MKLKQTKLEDFQKELFFQKNCFLNPFNDNDDKLTRLENKDKHVKAVELQIKIQYTFVSFFLFLYKINISIFQTNQNVY